MRRINILIDGGYFHELRRRLEVRWYDLRRLTAHMARGCLLQQTTYYDCLPHLSDESTDHDVRHYLRVNRYFQCLARLPDVSVKLGKLTANGVGPTVRRQYVQKQVDVAIGVDLAVAAARGFVTDIALLTGDSDLIPAVKSAQACGVRVHLFHDIDASRDLIDTCDSAIRLCAEVLAH